MNYPHLAARIFNTPLLIHPQKLDAIIAGLGDRLLGSKVGLSVDMTEAQLLPADMFSTRRGKRGDMGYVVTDGVAVLYASGALVHRSRIDADSTYLLGYNELAMQLEDAMSNPEVHAVLQIFDTPGGEVAGAFEYGDRVRALRGKKPLWAISDSLAASAGYLGSSAFEQLAVSVTGYVGSIGVVMRHVDLSRRLANDGINVTHIFAGDHKVDGNPYEPLPKEVRASLQAEVDSIYAMFVDAVSRNRGLSPQAVRNTQADVFRGEAAVSLGLADRLATTDELIAELAAKRSRSFPVGQTARVNANQGASMSGNTKEGGQLAVTPPVAPAASFTQADLDAARAEGVAAGAAAERARIQAVEEQLISGHESLINTMKFDGKSTGADAALAVNAAERNMRASVVQANQREAPKPVAVVPGATVQQIATPGPDASLSLEDRCKAAWQADSKLRTEFTSEAAYTAFVRAEEEGRARILKRG